MNQDQAGRHVRSEDKLYGVIQEKFGGTQLSLINVMRIENR